jgi:hypothetical protein
MQFYRVSVVAIIEERLDAAPKLLDFLNRRLLPIIGDRPPFLFLFPLDENALQY